MNQDDHVKYWKKWMSLCWESNPRPWSQMNIRWRRTRSTDGSINKYVVPCQTPSNVVSDWFCDVGGFKKNLYGQMGYDYTPQLIPLPLETDAALPSYLAAPYASCCKHLFYLNCCNTHALLCAWSGLAWGMLYDFNLAIISQLQGLLCCLLPNIIIHPPMKWATIE